MAFQSINKNIFAALSDHEEDNIETKPVHLNFNELYPTTPIFVESVDKTDVKNFHVTSPGKFKGRVVVPLHKERDNDYPMLGTKTESKRKDRKSSSHKPVVTRFVLATSYKSERQSNLTNLQTNNTDPRSRAFSRMENKEEMSKSLQCTSACKNVRRLNDKSSTDPEYSVCYRETCSFAHSLDELNEPMCSFDNTCRFINGKTLNDGSIDNKAKCKFLHSNETRADWMNRTGSSLPDLPHTHEKTRKPTVNNAKMNNAKAKMTASKAKIDVNITPIQMKSTIKPLIFQAPRKDQTFDSHKSKLSPRNSEVRKLSFPSDSSSESDYSRHRRRRRHKSRSPVISRSCVDSEFTRVISVPTSELAEIAIKAAISHGITNLRVIVE
jgi:hypothetical protein